MFSWTAYYRVIVVAEVRYYVVLSHMFGVVVLSHMFLA